ncbi:MAG TPA: hypothetical protein VK964_19895, partial [Nocardioidaceae bacterium]|nr:hypothetical protein [Nocardioidaceae bacterium]
MRSRLLMLAVATMLLILPAAPAQAIVNGVPDEGEHPFVGQLFFYVPDANDSRFNDPGAWYSCSGTLVDKNTVVTAGHCTFGVGKDGKPTTQIGGSGGTDVWISFEEEPDFSILQPSSTFVPDGNDARYKSWSAALDKSRTWHSATAYAHPEYVDRSFYMYDAGVLVLDKSVKMGAYGKL